MFAQRILFVGITLAALAGCAAHRMPVTVAETIAAHAQLSTLSNLVARTNLTETLKTSGPFTLFAPSNEAFAKLPAQTMSDLAADPVKLKAMLAYHVLPVKLMAPDVKNSTAKTLNGASVAISKAGDFVTIEDAVIQKSDILATNGVVHIVDSVLLPPAR